jgi:hypothetical protein
MGRRQTGGKAATDFVVGIEHKLNSTQVANMVRSIHLQWNGVGRPTIDVDASIYLYQFALRKKGPVKDLAAFLTAWASTGIDVACIFDNFAVQEMTQSVPQFSAVEREWRRSSRHSMPSPN